MKSSINIIIADDHAMFRQGVRTALRSVKEIDIVYEAENGEELVQACIVHQPDVVLTDIIMPVMNGIEATKLILSTVPDTAVVALTMIEHEAQIMDMIYAGALGYLVKNAQREQIIEALRSAYAGRSYLCQTAAVKSAGYVRRNVQEKKAENFFSERELQIIQLLCRQYTSPEIADKLFLSRKTVEWYRDRIMQKIGCTNVIGVVLYAISKGMFEVNKEIG